jgi:hypothetical protein
VTTLSYGLTSTSPTYAVNTAIRKRIREVLDDGRGIARVISPDRVDGDYWYPSEAFAGRSRAVVKPRFDILPFAITKTLPGLYEGCNVLLYDYVIEIAGEYALPPPPHSDDLRDAVRATAETDADAFRQALGWSGNLSQTEAGVDTGIVNGCIQFESFAPESEDWTAQRLITRHVYTAKVRVVTATS